MIDKNINKVITLLAKAMLVMYGTPICQASEITDKETSRATRIVKAEVLLSNTDTFIALKGAVVEIHLGKFIFNGGFIKSNLEKDKNEYITALRNDRIESVNAINSYMALAERGNTMAMNSLAKKFRDLGLYNDALKWYVHSFYTDLFYKKSHYEDIAAVKIMKSWSCEPQLDQTLVDIINKRFNSLPSGLQVVIKILKNINNNNMSALEKMFINMSYLNTQQAFDNNQLSLDYVRYNLMDAYSINDKFFSNLSLSKIECDQRIIKIHKKSVNPYGHHYLGGLYEKNFMGSYLTDDERYKIAAQYYYQSTLPESLICLINLYNEKKVGQELSHEDRNLILAILYLRVNHPDQDKKFIELYEGGKLGYVFRADKYLKLMEIASERRNIECSRPIDKRGKLFKIITDMTISALNENNIPEKMLIDILKSQMIHSGIDDAMMSISQTPVDLFNADKIRVNGANINNNIRSGLDQPCEKSNNVESELNVTHYNDVESNLNKSSYKISNQNSLMTTLGNSEVLASNVDTSTPLPENIADMTKSADIMLKDILQQTLQGQEVVLSVPNSLPVGHKMDVHEEQLDNCINKTHREIKKQKNSHYLLKKKDVRSDNTNSTKNSELLKMCIQPQPLYNIFFANANVQSSYNDMIKLGYAQTLTTKIDKIRYGTDKAEKVKYKLYTLYSVKINDEHRIVYSRSDNRNIIIHSCMTHYENLKIGTNTEKFILFKQS